MGSLARVPRPTRLGPLFTPDPSDFEGTVRQQLGDLGTGRDGFDAIFAVPAGAIDADTADLATLDEQIALADFNAGDFAGVYHAPVDAELPGFLSDGEALNAAVQDPGQVEGSPVITVIPPVPSGLGGGGGSGDGLGDIPTGDGCIPSPDQFTQPFPWCPLKL
jgi:hypothetical protein